jgi:thioredoxin-like negative regulator of GroEL
MQIIRRGIGMLMVMGLLAGCASAYREGQSSLRHGRYAEAADEFEAALKEDPGRLDALSGLGVARYKMGAYDAAQDALGRVVAQDPKQTQARLYLALAHVQKGEDRAAVEHLTAYRELPPGPRLGGAIDAAVKLLGSDRPLSTEVRRFMATSLEESAKLAREAREAQWAAQRAYAAPPLYPFHCYAARHGRIFCF